MNYALLLKTQENKYFPIGLDYGSKERAERGEKNQKIGRGQQYTYKVCPLSEVKTLLENDKMDFDGFTEKATKEKINFIRQN